MGTEQLSSSAWECFLQRFAVFETGTGCVNSPPAEEAPLLMDAVGFFHLL